MKMRILLVATPLSLLGLLMSCVSVKSGYIADDKLAATKAIEQFHSRLNASQTDQIYKDADEAFRQSQSKERTAENLRETQKRFGPFKRVTASELSVVVASPIQIRVVNNSMFEKGDATELFVLVKHGETVQIAQYQIFPARVGVSAP